MFAVACSFKLQHAHGLPQPPEEVHDPCVPMLHGGVCVCVRMVCMEIKSTSTEWTSWRL